MHASRPPWANWPSDLAGASGILWHADFIGLRRLIDVPKLWYHSNLNATRPLIVHMLADDPTTVGFTFSAVDEAQSISDAIGEIFDALLMSSRTSEIDWSAESYWNAWRQDVRAIDFRVLSGTGWNIVDESTVPVTNFGAGGGVESAPSW